MRLLPQGLWNVFSNYTFLEILTSKVYGGVIPMSSLLVDHCMLVEDFCMVSSRVSVMYPEFMVYCG